MGTVHEALPLGLYSCGHAAILSCASGPEAQFGPQLNVGPCSFDYFHFPLVLNASADGFCCYVLLILLYSIIKVKVKVTNLR